MGDGAPMRVRAWVSAQRSLASLRTALWRIRQADEKIVLATRAKVQLDERVEVDVRQCMAQARRLVATGCPRSKPRTSQSRPSPGESPPTQR